MSISEAIVIAPGEGRVISRRGTGGAITIKLPSETMGGAATVFESSRPPEGFSEPGVHCHPGFDEMVYILAGEYEFVAGSQSVLTEAGTFVFIPRGIFHGFRSSDESAGRLLAVCIPGGVEDLFEETAHSVRR